jgi:tRNA(fMet)-specific endonuclease VapC
VDAETARVAAFVLSRQVLPCDTGTAYHYAVVKDELRRRGRPIPENDLWIAALARQYGLTLATRDAHYAGIDQLRTDPCRN